MTVSKEVAPVEPPCVFRNQEIQFDIFVTCPRFLDRVL
jgi:hypothetical protein